MHRDLETHLEALAQALKDQDPALTNDILWDARERLRQELATVAWNNPHASEDERVARVLAETRPPEAVLAQALQQERIVRAALRPMSTPTVKANPTAEAESPAQAPWPTFWGVLADTRTYTALLYLLLALPVGIFYFIWFCMGLSVSLSLIPILVGLPLLGLFLMATRALALGESRLVEVLLDIRMPRRPSALPEGKGLLGRLKALLSDGFTWSSLLYCFVHFPLSIATFTATVALLSVSLALLAAPFLCLTPLAPHITLTTFRLEAVPLSQVPGPQLALFALLALLVLVGSLHAVLGLGRLHGLLAKALLVKRR